MGRVPGVQRKGSCGPTGGGPGEGRFAEERTLPEGAEDVSESEEAACKVNRASEDTVPLTLYVTLEKSPRISHAQRWRGGVGVWG